MCWWSKRKPVAKIAKKDIPVKKVIYTDGTAYFNSFNYKTRKVIPKVEIEVKKTDYLYGGNGVYTIRSGYHSYSSRCVFTEEKFSICYAPIAKQTICVKNSCDHYPIEIYYVISKKFRRIKVQDFIIPKGTKYYINERGEYVSELIRIV